MDRHANVAGCRQVIDGVRELFSLDRAERALVLVRSIVADASAMYSHLLQTQRMLEKLQRCGPIEEIHRLQEEMGVSVSRLEEHMSELAAVGAELRDLDRGEADFPAFVGGRIVHLCWRLGEERISHWHEPDGDFMQRRPIAELIGVSRVAPLAS